MSSVRSPDANTSQPSLKRGREQQKPSKSRSSNHEASTAQTVINQHIYGMAVKEEPGVKEVSMEVAEAPAKAQPFIMKLNISP
ncbi:hypothetical protein MSAN_02513700 [Mycena sanguinolenta]|uniref:Uncharacterized protein n=1 Tax=Mycena sanguinolenta TaxID=230812 RepID=A0A8H6WNT9_9AGAR|nr:hypothetical protein MSAN_02513700 [Mycena sanguinolenta]